MVDGEVASVATSFLPASLVPGLAAHLADGDSLYETLTARYGVRPTRRWSNAELVPVPHAVAALLGFEGRPPAWALRSCNACTRLDQPIELATSWLRADVFRVVFQLGEGPR
jgi:DNA-binding GntR family transcriptional regulator